jgi:hypothetical protein
MHSNQLRIRGRTLGRAVALALAAAFVALFAGAPLGSIARADVRLVVREESWSLGRKPPALATLVRTEVSGRMRRLENEVVAGARDSLRKVARHVQIDRVDKDTSYYCRPDEKAYLTVGYSGARDANLRRAAAFRRAQVLGQAPRDTIPPVRVRDLGRSRVLLGVPCRGYVVTLRFAYRDSMSAPGEPLGGVLADTVWMAPAGSAPDEVARFEEAFARATAADSFMVAPNAVQLAQSRGQGLVSVLTRALRRLPGFALASSYENVLYGVPKGMAGMDRRPDGGVVVQRTRRDPLELSHTALPVTRFEVPAGYRRLGPGLGVAGAAGAAGGPGPP